MTLAQIYNPYSAIPNLVGLGNTGYVYIGVENEDPKTNPQAVYWDQDGMTPATQPLAMVGGYIMNSGAPAQAFTASPFSMTVTTAADVQVWTNPSVSGAFNPVIEVSAADVTYTPSGANAVSTTAQAWMRLRPITPQDFGAVMDGVTDDGIAWQAFRDALAASSRPTGYIPSGTLLTSIVPNFAIQNLVLETGSNVRVKYNGSGAAGFLIDGSSNVGGNVTGVYGITIGRLIVQADNATSGSKILKCHHGNIAITVTGAQTNGHLHEGNVCTTFDRCSVSNNEATLTHAPTIGLLVDRSGAGEENSYCIYPNMTMEGITSGTGLKIDYGLGNVFIGGTAEGCATGANLTANAQTNRFLGTDFEANSTVDITCAGLKNEFNVDTDTLVHFTGSAYRNVISGGEHQAITLDSGTSANQVLNVGYNRNATGGVITNNNPTNVIGPNIDLTLGVYQLNGFVSGKSAITAHAGGGRASAIALVLGVNRITICATAGDSVALPPTKGVYGQEVVIVHVGLTYAQVFADGSDQINFVAGATGIPQQAGSIVRYVSTSSARWEAGMPQVITLAGTATYVDDAAAAAGGIPVGGIYRNGSIVQIRVA